VTFSLATVDTSDGERAALMTGGSYYRLDVLAESPVFQSVRRILDAWGRHWPLLERLAAECDAGEARAVRARLQGEIALLAPIKFPNKLVCVGAVYKDHLAEFNLPATRWPKMPIFLRPPTTSIVGPGDTLVPPRTTRQFDWEIELAVVVARRIKDADQATAAAAIAGYCVGLDMTCRDLLDADSPTGVDLVRAKAQDGMAPLGPALMPAAFVHDPQNLRLKLWVNGELKQSGSTANMLFPIAEQLSTISQFITLEPGDVVFTGSPAGSAAKTGAYLKIGDRIRAEIEQVGCLELTVTDSPTAEREQAHG
jgi:2-keto-4-pentenoate hydratase/2-oxohepta-3-ene-1,7-dioic acid hydratase in catechol pathway